MVQAELVFAGFLGMLVFITFAIHYELGLGYVVSAMLSVSAMSIGLLIAAGTQYYLGLSMEVTAVGLSVLVFMMALVYDVVS